MNRVKPPSTERGLERIEHRTKNRLRNPLDRWTTLRWNTELRRNLGRNHKGEVYIVVHGEEREESESRAGIGWSTYRKDMGNVPIR